ncbi:MAG TPA: FAD-dependent oxidoreductase [Candidatus Competibacteraceae bacterium]|nr:FAD-dependent oxidoreductase [Candidatus Competibacteraceae bacterium]
MSELPGQTRVVVIGGGAVGCSVLYHLTEKGWRDVLLLERNELTSGSTWHAAGNCPNFSSNWELLRLQDYSTRLYRRLAELADYPINYHITGSVRLAHGAERMEEYRLVCGKGRYIGVEFELLGLQELKVLYPFIELHDLRGALWDPHDGDIDPAQLTQALARAARNAGARIVRFCAVRDLRQRPSGEWEVITDRGTVVAEIVVNAAGYYAPRIGAMMGRELPSVVLEHQYLVTAELPALAGRDGKLPLLRDPDDSYYLRQERSALLLGPYEHRGAQARWSAGLPEDFAFQLFADDLERIESYIEAACRRVPILAEAGIQKVINGPIPYTPDGNPLIGPVPGVRNAYECCVFSFGITQAGGAGKLLADWIVEGEPEWELWSCDPRRFTGHVTPAYTLAKAIEVYENEYAIGFPNEERPAGRPARTSPTYPRLAAKGARFGARNGWERPTWFPRPDDDPQPPPTFGRPHWFAAVAEECRAVQERAGLLDLTGLTRFELSGPGAIAWLDRLLCSRLPRVGRVGLAYLCTPRGRILSEATVARLAEDRFWLMSAAAGEWHDRDWLMQHLPGDGSVRLEELTTRYGTLVLVGPAARAILSRLTDTPLDSARFPWLSVRPLVIGTSRIQALRVNYVGELGWELHVPMESMLPVYDALHAAGAAHGLRDFGLYAQDALRLEKCYRSWKQDLSIESSPFEAALERFVDLDKADFIGRAALLQERAAGVARRLVPLLVDAAGADACSGALVYASDAVVGYVSSGGYGHRIQRSIALAYVGSAHAVPGTTLSVAIGAERRPATVAREPLYDPDNLRLQA